MQLISHVADDGEDDQAGKDASQAVHDGHQDRVPGQQQQPHQHQAHALSPCKPARDQ